MGSSAVFHKLKAMLATDLDRAAKARRLADVIREFGTYRWVGIYDVDMDQGLVSNVAWSGAGAPEYPVFPISKGLTSRAIANKATVNVGDVQADPDYLTALSTTRSEIIVPVVDGRGEVAGTIDVESERPHAFDISAQQTLEQCAETLKTFWRR